jgi:hypothetical protein
MTLTEYADVAVPKTPRDRYRLIEVLCALCGFDEIAIWKEEVICASCHARICVLCGCVDELACVGGCWWILPGVCSSHEDDPRVTRMAIPATAHASLGMLN